MRRRRFLGEKWGIGPRKFLYLGGILLDLKEILLTKNQLIREEKKEVKNILFIWKEKQFVPTLWEF